MSKLDNIVTLVQILFKRTPARATEWGLFDQEPEPIRMSPENARAELETIIRHYKVKRGYFTMEDMYPVLKTTGRQRTWMHNELRKRIEDGTIIYDGNTQRYEIMQ